MSAAFLVADSGPLIALARLDLLDLPAHYFESVLVTSTVWEEVTRKPDVDETPRLSAAAEAKLIRMATDPETIPATLLRTTIDAGVRGARSGVPHARGDEPFCRWLADRHREVFPTRVGMNRVSGDN